ncbi:unannotated protein [freshwater metagenome]|uniref:Unannotated protein n=1 Tax=freshwater metagenome TaxID=449393 RepID=A0A6J7SGN9_9ZZZZ|nr:DUF1003 domain-containing protein [Actinomycetota bacterium]MSW37129.1 DUF1003 domain-containing protein [Actinomycetota bacterium]
MARDEPRGHRLDQPLERGISLRPTVDPEAVNRISERIARFLGSWHFIGYMTSFVVIWVIYNLSPLAVDAFPFIFLTLLLSLQASYAAPLILLAQNRQADRDRVQYKDDRARTDRLVADTEYLMREIASLRVALGEVATRDFIRSELRDLVDDLEDREPKVRKKKKPKSHDLGDDRAGDADAVELVDADHAVEADPGAVPDTSL